MTTKKGAVKATGSSAPGKMDIVAKVAALGPEFAARAGAADENDRFVAENYRALKDAGLVEAGVPKELGGGGAEVAELAAMLRELAHHCGSTALAFSMHTHQVAIPAWRWRHQNVAAVEPLVRRVANEKPFSCPAAARTGSGDPARPRRSMAATRCRRGKCSLPARPPAAF